MLSEHKSSFIKKMIEKTKTLVEKLGKSVSPGKKKVLKKRKKKTLTVSTPFEFHTSKRPRVDEQG